MTAIIFRLQAVVADCWRMAYPLLATSVLLLTFHPGRVGAQAIPRTPRVMGSVHVAPTPVATSDGVLLAYELHITNRDNRAVTLTRLEVLRGDGSGLATYEDGLLHQMLDRGASGRRLQGEPRAVLAPGSWATVWLWVTVADSAVPSLLRHRLTLALEDSSGARPEVVREVGTSPLAAPAPEIGPPLGKGLWWTVRISNTSGHRRGIDQGGRIPERFAIDFFRVDDFGRNRTSNLFVNENHFAYGAPVLAVADGVVLSAADSMAENAVGRQPVRRWPATLGNYVELEIAPGVYAQYLHLQSGSVTVRAGDVVTRGQVIGRLGNTGASIAPHLHFQLETRPVPAGRSEQGRALGEGLPFAFSSYALVGERRVPHCRCQGTECSIRPLDIRHREIPTEGQVVRFISEDIGEVEPAAPSDTRAEALCHVATGQLLRDAHRIPEAVAAYAQALKVDAGLAVPALQYGALCWRGGLWGFAEEVLATCEQAVRAEPDHPDLKRRRALARALTGDLVGAVADFEEYLAWLSTEPPLATWEASFDGLASRSVDALHAQVSEWSRVLRDGHNPFTAEVVEALRAGVRPPE